MMTDNHMQQKTNAGMLFTGMVVGALLGAGAIILSDEKKRKQLMDKIEHMRKKTTDMMRETKGRARTE